MITYVTIGAKDVEASGKFYDAFFTAFGRERKYAEDGWIGYGPKGSEENDVHLCSPFDGKPATFGNGMMLSFAAKSIDEVRAAHAAGLAAGGSDEGAPGYRPPEKTAYFGAYLRDPTGNKLAVFFKP